MNEWDVTLHCPTHPVQPERHTRRVWAGDAYAAGLKARAFFKVEHRYPLYDIEIVSVELADSRTEDIYRGSERATGI